MRNNIMPNDTILHKPTNETWIVCGVNIQNGTLIPFGYPFPTIAKTEDCELLEYGYESNPQSLEQIQALQKEGLTNYIDVTSALFHGIL